MEAIFSAGTSQPCRFGTWRTEMDPKGSLPSAPLWRSVTSAPMRSSVRVKPMRAVFRLTSSITMSLPRTSAAAQAMNAADEGSPGTATSLALSRHGPVTLAVQLAAVVGTPNSGSMSSVWLREGEGSTSVVVPCANTPARSTAVFSWAEAMGAS